MRYPVLAFLAALVIAASVPVAAQSPVPALTGRVVDTAGLLIESTRLGLEAQLAAHERETSNQVVVLTIPRLENETIEGAAERAFNAWGLGQAATDNGVLLLIARDDRQLRIEVGYGLEGDLTDAQAGRIIRNVIVPRFRADDFDGGIAAGVEAILATIAGTYDPPVDTEDDIPLGLRLIFLCTHVLLPGTFAYRGLMEPGFGRYATMLFLSVFVLTGSFLMIPYPWSLWVVGFFLLSFFSIDIYMSRSPHWKAIRKKVGAASKKGKTTKVSIGGFTFSAGGGSSGGSGGGGGFSGGGGSSGGGGASGGW
ncbi:hypothetical protein BH23BAC4_BH23BAC4_12830 [soil metagenome]